MFLYDNLDKTFKFPKEGKRISGKRRKSLASTM